MRPPSFTRGPAGAGFLPFCLAAGAALRLAIAWAPLEWLLRYVLADDTFYYLNIARNFAQGHGVSFDRLAETNGFHPLWMLIILPVYGLIEDRTLAVHAVLTLNALTDTLSIYLLYKLLGEFGAGEFPRRLTCGLYAFAPALVSHVGPMNGLETALNLLLTLLYLLLYRRAAASGAWSVPAALGLGLASGLLFLARTDNAILLAVTYAYLALTRTPPAVALGRLAAAGAAGAALAVPWLIWCYVKFGSVVQVSGQSLAFMLRTAAREEGWTGADYLRQFAGSLAATAAYVPVYLHDTPALSPVAATAGLILAALAVAAWRAWRRTDRVERAAWWQGVKPLAAPLAAVVLFVLVHVSRGVYMRGWYYMSTVPALLTALTLLLDRVLKDRARRHPAGGATARTAAAAAAVALLTLSAATLARPRYGEVDKFKLVQAMNAKLPSGARVGSWNAGVYGYFFERGVVVGLDGLVNNEAYPYIRARTLARYCRDRQITYLADPVESLRYVQRFWAPGGPDLVGSLRFVHAVYGQKERCDIVVGRLDD